MPHKKNASHSTLPSQIEESLKKTPYIVTREAHTSTVFTIYSTTPIYLSTIMPYFTFMGIEIIDASSESSQKEAKQRYIYKFHANITDFDRLNAAQAHIIDALQNALLGTLSINTPLFALIFLENFSLREIKLLQATVEYLAQAVRTLNISTLVTTLCTHHAITKAFVTYFHNKFAPNQTYRDKHSKELFEEITTQIKAVPYITDDQLLNLVFELLVAMTRTNYFFNRDAIAFKIDHSHFKENLKGLQPNIESFVYDEKLYGVHLRMSHISRGGLRWSSRHDDYRQEIKSLMITQDGKNAIIVPNGAKGGFIIKEDPANLSKERFEAYYTLFIENLLDLIDNKIQGKLQRDERIVAYDEEDSYFVVAADKGTANMSDVANAIALKRAYWLGDAFASGGSHGYSHKALGITAKGAMKSTQRFFIEKGIDFTTQSISVVGIGSMNGDVFGNGIQLSQNFKLLGVVSSKEIFIDPDPIPMVAWQERQQLFMAKKGHWSQYNKSLISRGGGVFLRSEKSIELSPEIKKLLNTTRKTLSGEELGRKLLCINVDLLFNGGVGTYVKSSEESNVEIGDKQNEALRLDASELKAYAVCEGGNLGFTQKARIEYAKNGGKINLDGIDNAAGVNISDHEVNLKILLDLIASKGHITVEQKRELLQDNAEKIVNIVLWNNYLQALALSKEERISKEYLDEYVKIIALLETHMPNFNRKDFTIPKDDSIGEILNKEGAIVRPVLASLLSYSKLFIKQKLLESEFIKDAHLQSYLFKYFPKTFSAYQNELFEHPLKYPIIATVLSDMIINTQGILFLSNYAHLGDEDFILKIRSYLINNQLFGANDIRYRIYRKDYELPAALQYEMLFDIEKALAFSTDWMVRYQGNYKMDESSIMDHKETLFALLTAQKNPKNSLATGDEIMDDYFELLNYLRFSVTVMTIHEDTHGTFEEVATLFFIILNRLRIIPLLEALDALELHDPNLRKERRQLRQLIEYVIVKITHKVQNFRRKDEGAQEAFENFLQNGGEAVQNSEIEVTHFFEKNDKPTLHDVTIVVHSLMFSAL